MPFADIDQVLDSKTRVLCALDQPTFTPTKGNSTFGVLVPLMTEDGRRFQDPESTFPNRGRVWWMLLPENIRDFSTTGAIWSAVLDHAVRTDLANPDKDFYQLERFSTESGTKEWFDVLDVGFDPRDMTLTLAPSGIAVDRQPLKSVLLRGGGVVAGPFLAAWNGETQRAKLSAVNVGNPIAYVAPAQSLKAGEHVEEFRFTANRWYRQEREREVVIRLVARRHLDVLQKSGTPLDAASDEQVIKWALTQANYTGSERSAFREALARVPTTVSPDEPVGRRSRFHALCEQAEKVRGLGVEVAEAIAHQPAFKALLDAHATELVKKRVEDAVAQRTTEIEKEAKAAREKGERLKKEVAGLESDYDRRKAEQEKRLAAENDRWLADLRRREEEVVERERGIEARQKAMEARLADVVRRYEEKGAALGDDLLAQVPILRRLGLGVGGGGEVSPESAPRFALPTWFEAPRPAAGLSEEAFVAQFADVARRRGYVFDDEDLIAFHLAMKVGFWTVLAGPSGTGKTSLPRLYAEALGASDEFHSIPVRPDWLDDRDVVGAFNALAGRFEPAATGLVDRLIAASEDLASKRGGIYVVCLDEMNLARVEHYFAQFLSVLEEPAHRRRLHLFGKGVERPGEAYSKWRELPIGGNVRFVGTVNIDETTHFFSPKVLDRAPVLVFRPPAIDRPPAPPSKATTLGLPGVRYDEFAAWARRPDQADPAARSLVVEIDRQLRPIRSGLGFRLRDRVLAYAASANGLIGSDRALDLALSQSVLPRIRTTETGFRDALSGLIEHLPAKRFPVTAGYLEAMKERGDDTDFFHLLGS